MSRRGFTKKPCHGCGGTDERRSDHVCNNCKKRLKMAGDYVDMTDRLRGDGMVTVRVPDSWSCFHLFPRRMSNIKFNYDKIGKLFNRLVKNIFVESPGKYYFDVDDGYRHGSLMDADFSLFENDSKHDSTTVVIMPREVFEILDELHKEIKSELLLREDSAFAYGSNLLVRLNDGNLTAEDFDKEVDK